MGVILNTITTTCDYPDDSFAHYYSYYYYTQITIYRVEEEVDIDYAILNALMKGKYRIKTRKIKQIIVSSVL